MQPRAGRDEEVHADDEMRITHTVSQRPTNAPNPHIAHCTCACDWWDPFVQATLSLSLSLSLSLYLSLSLSLSAPLTLMRATWLQGGVAQPANRTRKKQDCPNKYESEKQRAARPVYEFGFSAMTAVHKALMQQGVFFGLQSSLFKASHMGVRPFQCARTHKKAPFSSKDRYFCYRSP